MHEIRMAISMSSGTTNSGRSPHKMKIISRGWNCEPKGLPVKKILAILFNINKMKNKTDVIQFKNRCDDKQ